MTDKTPAPQVWPTMQARNARALIRFLVDAFGFEETAVYGEGDRVDHAELSWPPGGGIMLGLALTPTLTTTGHSRLAALPPCRTDDPDGLFARATAAGAEILTGLHDTDYGSRDFAVRDPEGNRWSFGPTGSLLGPRRVRPMSRYHRGILYRR